MNKTILPIRDLIILIRDFVGKKEWNAYSKEQKLKWINNYRKAESDTNKQIEKHGSVEKWYLSGEGRLLTI